MSNVHVFWVRKGISHSNRQLQMRPVHRIDGKPEQAILQHLTNQARRLSIPLHHGVWHNSGSILRKHVAQCGRVAHDIMLGIEGVVSALLQFSSLT